MSETVKLTEAQWRFLTELVKWNGVASPQDIGPQVTRGDNSARQTCKRRGWTTFDKYYWRITEAGRLALRNKEHG